MHTALLALLLAQPAPPSGGLAQLYAYRLLDPARFEEGYRRHLAWHAAHGDTLVWYGWFVSQGERPGTFVDGTFGATAAALDGRPDLAGDAADFQAQAAPHAVPLASETWVLWPEVSTGTALERGEPSRALDVYVVELAPDAAERFDRALEALARGHTATGGSLTAYRPLRGVPEERRLLVVARGGWSSVRGPLARELADALGVPVARVRAVLAGARSVRSETWSYAPALSRIPASPGAR